MYVGNVTGAYAFAYGYLRGGVESLAQWLEALSKPEITRRLEALIKESDAALKNIQEGRRFDGSSIQ